MTEWYYAIDDDVRGPVDWDDLRRLARDGAVRPGTMVRRGGGAWVMARHVPGLFEGVAAEAAPFEEPARRYGLPRPDEDYRPPPDDDYRMPPPARNGVVTAYGVSTLVLSGILTVGGCVSGIGSLFCFSFFGPGGVPPPSAAGGCAGLFAAVFWAMAVILALVTVVHLALAGGHFAAGLGILRRRPWARILALVVSFFSLAYGGFALYLVGAALTQSGGPPREGMSWVFLTGIIGVLFIVHAVLTWVVMFHPACAGDFRPAAAPRGYDD